MANIKTAISLQKSLFDQVNTLALELHVSRSRVFVLALENYLREVQDQLLFEKINKAVEEASSEAAERTHLQQLRQQHRRIVEGEW